MFCLKNGRKVFFMKYASQSMYGTNYNENNKHHKKAFSGTTSSSNVSHSMTNFAKNLLGLFHKGKHSVSQKLKLTIRHKC